MNWNLCKTLIGLAVLAPGILSQSALLNCGGDFTEVEAILYPSSNLNADQEAYFYLSYNAPYDVSDGYIITSVNVNGVPYPDSRSDLCKSTAKFSELLTDSETDDVRIAVGNEILCPIVSGTHSGNSSFTVPNMDGSFKSKIRWFTESGTLLLCIKMLVEVIPGPGRAAW
jgi:hypothetical protein